MVTEILIFLIYVVIHIPVSIPNQPQDTIPSIPPPSLNLLQKKQAIIQILENNSELAPPDFPPLNDMLKCLYKSKYKICAEEILTKLKIHE